MAADYIAEILTVQPEGPYVLIGDCIGGAVAVEAARQLAANGQRIRTLILLDSDRPSTLKHCADRVSRFRRKVIAAVSRHVRTAKSRLRRIVQGDVAARLRTHTDGGRGSGSSESDHASQNPINPAADIHRAAEAVRRSLLSYRAGPYDGQIKLVVNEKWFRRSGTLGWGEIASRGVEPYVAPGDHLTYTEAGEPAETVAGQIEKWIEEASGAHGNTADRRPDAVAGRG